jgi:hypothetical protein
VRIESIGVKTFKEHKGIYMSSINTISLTNNNNNAVTYYKPKEDGFPL